MLLTSQYLTDHIPANETKLRKQYFFQEKLQSASGNFIFLDFKTNCSSVLFMHKIATKIRNKNDKISLWGFTKTTFLGIKNNLKYLFFLLAVLK
jgi:hypothetical protein